MWPQTPDLGNLAPGLWHFPKRPHCLGASPNEPTATQIESLGSPIHAQHSHIHKETGSLLGEEAQFT